MPVTRIESLSDAQISDLHALYQGEWWSVGRSLDDVRLVVANSSLLVGYVDDEGRLIAFCRVLTDFVFRATIYDVIVAERYRGQGLGRMLMDAVTSHPRLGRVSVLWLCCEPEMIPFYKKWGFVIYDEGPIWMIKPQREG